MAVKTEKIAQSNQKTRNKQGQNVDSYENLHFNDATIAIIKAYNLQNDDEYSALITQYERIDSLNDEDTRKPGLMDLWETEFNRLFKEFWEQNLKIGAVNNKLKSNNKKEISNWKDRLDIKPSGVTPEDLRNSLVSKLNVPVSITSSSNSREQIMRRAGFQNNSNSQKQFSYKADAKNSQLDKIEAILSDENGPGKPSSILINDDPFSNSYNLFGSGLAEGPVGLEANIKEDETIIDSQEIDEPIIPVIENEEDDDNKELDNQSQANEDKQDDTYQNIESEYDKYINTNINKPMFDYDSLTTKNTSNEFAYTHSYEDVKPEKRNILSKDDFEYFEKEQNNEYYEGFDEEEKDENASKPYHEIRPVGHYGITAEPKKRPLLQEIFDDNKKRIEDLDELSEKISLLEDLRNERRHRISLMRFERTNSFIVARARRIAERRQLIRQKRIDNQKKRSIQHNERMRRLNERQKLIQLMKERQMKRAEEKRVATVLRIERQRRLQREANNRNEIALLDAQIRHEQEMIKRAELKMKTYFTKNMDELYFDESLKLARKNSKYAVTAEKIDRINDLEEAKRVNRIEKISRKFVKNQK